MKLDFKKIVPAAQAGSKPARDTLMTAFYGWSVVQAGNVLKDSDAAATIAVQFWEWLFAKNGIKKFDAQKGGFYPWMQAQIRFMAQTATKRQYPDVRFTDKPLTGVIDLDPLTRLSGRHMLKAIKAALPSPSHREVLHRMMEGYRAKEIAVECDLAEGKVRSMMGVIRKLIRQTLDKEEP